MPWETDLYGLHQNLSFPLVSSWVLSMEGRKRIKLGHLFPLPPFPRGLEMAASPNKSGTFKCHSPLGFVSCPLLLYPFRVTLPFQVKGESMDGSKGNEIQESKGDKDIMLLIFGKEDPTIPCISLLSIQTFINTNIIKLSSIYPI